MFSVECWSEYTKTWALMFAFIKINFQKLSLGFMNCISYLTIIIIIWFSIWSIRWHWHKTVSFNCKVFLLWSQPTNRHFCTLCLCTKQLATENEHTQWTQKTAFDWKSSCADWEETLPLQLCVLIGIFRYHLLQIASTSPADLCLWFLCGLWCHLILQAHGEWSIVADIFYMLHIHHQHSWKIGIIFHQTLHYHF